MSANQKITLEDSQIVFPRAVPEKYITSAQK